MTSLQIAIHQAVQRRENPTELAFAVEHIFYGAYSVLVFICVHVLWTRPGLQKRIQHLACVMALYGLTTAQIVLNFIWYFTSRVNEPRLETTITVIAIFSQTALLIVSLITNAIFIQRCYLIWGRDEDTIIVPVLTYLCMITLLVLSSLKFTASWHLGAVIMAMFAFITASFITIVIPVLFSAGRIWLIRRAETSGNWYNTASAVILDSGMLYLAMLVVTGIMTFVIPIRGEAVTTAIWTLWRITNQLVGIAPTLIILRLGLAVGYDTEESPLAVLGDDESEHISTVENAFTGIFLPHSKDDLFAAIGINKKAAVEVNFGAEKFMWSEGNDWAWSAEGVFDVSDHSEEGTGQGDEL
ncbi:hypothetical protein C8J56DRAFT_898864 [Mycena floridula]|nr:hypothetical protein C8J56DRAFT_898864 [Mycena floridula]